MIRYSVYLTYRVRPVVHPSLCVKTTDVFEDNMVEAKAKAKARK